MSYANPVESLDGWTKRGVQDCYNMVNEVHERPQNSILQEKNPPKALSVAPIIIGK